MDQERALKILLVDDNEDHVYLAKRSLQESGKFLVDPAMTGVEALQKAGSQEYDAILLDYNLPDMSGLQVLQKLLDSGCEVPVVMVTGGGSESVAVEAMRAGAYDYVVKSVDYQGTLPPVIYRALDRNRLIQRNKELQRKLQEQATTDFLTGLFNRQHFSECYEYELARARRYGNHLAVIMLDVNRFKHMNDTYGHRMGDQILRRIGQVLKDSIRATDIAARYGGDEFIIALPAGSDSSAEDAPAGAQAVVARIRENIEAVNASGEFPEPISLSIGISCADGDCDHLLESADHEMYVDKRRYYQQYPKRRASGG